MRFFSAALLLISTLALGQGLPIKSGNSSTLLNLNTNGHPPVDSSDSYGNNFISIENHQQMGVPSIVFQDPVEGSTVDTNLWTGSNTTMAQAVSGGSINLNSGAITTANTNAHINSIKQFNMQLVRAALAGTTTITTPSGVQANQTMRLGFYTPNGASAPTDGCWFEWNASAEFRGVLSIASSVNQTAALTAPTINVSHTMLVQYGFDQCLFYVDGALVGTVSQANVGAAMQVGKLPFSASIVIGATPPVSAPRLSVFATTVERLNIDSARPWGHQLVSGSARGAYQSVASTYGQTANWANSSSPSSATLSNTAAGYTTLGGRYQFAAPAGAATDFALFGYQVPAGYQLHVNQVQITACNTGAAVATTATMLDWGVATNSSAVSLATTDALGPPPTTWAPRRIAMGFQGFIVGAAIGQCATPIFQTFDPPIAVDSGRFFHVVVQVPVGTATASQVIRGDVLVHGWFE